MTELNSIEYKYWRAVKLAAANDPDGMLVGLARIGIGLRNASLAVGEKLADDPLPRATSLACASVVDDAIAKMAAAGELTGEEVLKLAALNAESALRDIDALVCGEKNARSAEVPATKKHPVQRATAAEYSLRKAVPSSTTSAKVPGPPAHEP